MNLNKKELKQFQNFGLTEEEISEVLNMVSKVPRRINVPEAKKSLSSIIKQLKRNNGE